MGREFLGIVDLVLAAPPTLLLDEPMMGIRTVATLDQLNELMMGIGRAAAPDHLDELMMNIRTAATPDQLRGVAAEVGEAVQRDPSAIRGAELVLQLGVAWRLRGHFDASIEALSRLPGGWNGQYDQLAHLAMAATFREEGRREMAMQALRKALDAEPTRMRRHLGEGPVVEYAATLMLAAAYEDAGDWGDALMLYETHRPPVWSFDDYCVFCGTCIESRYRRHQDSLTVAQARCRFHLGDVDRSLGSLWPLVKRGHVHASFLLAEFSIRSGRVAEAMKKMRRLAPEARGKMEMAIGFCQCLFRKDVEGMIRALSPLDLEEMYLPSGGEEQMFVAARLLRELGSPAVEHLSACIARSDRRVFGLAGLSGLRGLVPALERRLANEGDTNSRNRIKRALEALARHADPG